VEAEDWRQLRLHALEALAGRLAASAAVRAEPLRESAHAALIQVHLAEDNQSEALREFTRYRTPLHAELGLEPTPRLCRLARPKPVTLWSWSVRHDQLVTTSRVGLLLIRAWVEPGSSSPLRAHVRSTNDVSQGFRQSLTVADKEAIVAVVQAWLSEMRASSFTGDANSRDLPDT
jgi:hypothetical protein